MERTRFEEILLSTKRNGIKNVLEELAKTDFYKAFKEMKAGEKRNHWIWYIFPQIKGLGQSPNAQYYGITCLEEAKTYLEHPILGARLREITQEVLNHASKGIQAIMGAPIDAMKFRSSMTLFDAVSPNDIFAQALNTFFEGERDQFTINLLNK